MVQGRSLGLTPCLKQASATFSLHWSACWCERDRWCNFCERLSFYFWTWCSFVVFRFPLLKSTLLKCTKWEFLIRGGWTTVQSDRWAWRRNNLVGFAKFTSLRQKIAHLEGQTWDRGWNPWSNRPNFDTQQRPQGCMVFCSTSQVWSKRWVCPLVLRRWGLTCPCRL